MGAMSALLLLLALARAASPLFLPDVTVVDAQGPRGPVDVLVREGRIAEIGDLDPGDAEVLPVAGMTVVPGLVDSHVHISMAPGAAWRDPVEDERAQRAHHLRAYLAAGVTTILDPAILPEDAREIRALVEAGPAPRVLMLGPTFSPEGGYVQAAIPEFPGVSTPEEALALFDTFDGLDPIGVKVTMENGPLFDIWPLHPPEVRTAITTEAAARGLDVYVHAMSAAMYDEALAMGPRCIVHGPDEPLGADRVAAVVESGVIVQTTLAISGSALLQYHPEDLQEPLTGRVVPVEELETARSARVHAGFPRAALALMAPQIPGFLRGLVVKLAANEAEVDKRLRHMEEAIAELHEAGVPLALGSDAGNWPIIPFLFHGPSTHLEVKLLEEAGLEPLEVLVAATLTPARLLRIDDEIGTVEVGKVADLVVVDGDPLSDLSLLRDPRFVLRAGVAHTPAEWMTVGVAPEE